jgi:hypothetical protein
VKLGTSCIFGALAVSTNRDGARVKRINMPKISPPAVRLINSLKRFSDAFRYVRGAANPAVQSEANG